MQGFMNAVCCGKYHSLLDLSLQMFSSPHKEGPYVGNSDHPTCAAKHCPFPNHMVKPDSKEIQAMLQ
jgi:hypothetical protein